MNEHNEQQALPCPFCGREPDLSFNSVSCGCAASPFIDREDALQVWNTRAAQPSPVVKQNLTTQPAAAQEAVAEPIYQLRKADGSWVDQAKHSYDYNMAQGHKADLRVVYAAPVTAAPADHLHAHLLHMLGAKDHEDAGRIIGQLHAATMRTPGAPGIDIEHFHRTVQRICIKFDGDLPYISGIAEVLDLIDASPKGGSEARDSVLAALVEAATAVERADADGELTDDLVDRLRAARDAAQAGDAEVQP